MAVVMATSSGGLGLTEQENNQVSKWQSLPWEESEGSNTPKKGSFFLFPEKGGHRSTPTTELEIPLNRIQENRC